MDTRLETLRSDLDEVSEHLASLRKTINNIDSTIPFLKISGDEEDETGEPEDLGEPAGPGDGEPGGDGAAGDAEPPEGDPPVDLASDPEKGEGAGG